MRSRTDFHDLVCFIRGHDLIRECGIYGIYSCKEVAWQYLLTSYGRCAVMSEHNVIELTIQDHVYSLIEPKARAATTQRLPSWPIKSPEPCGTRSSEISDSVSISGI